MMAGTLRMARLAYARPEHADAAIQWRQAVLALHPRAEVRIVHAPVEHGFEYTLTCEGFGTDAIADMHRGLSKLFVRIAGKDTDRGEAHA